MSEQAPAPKVAVTAVDQFVDQHGPSTAVVQGVILDQVRITLVGADGALGDVLVRDGATAQAVVEASRAQLGEWDRELAGSVTLGAAYRERMARGQAL